MFWAEPHSSFPLILQTKLSQFGSEKFGSKKCWIWNFFGYDKILGLKKNLVWKYFVSEKCQVWQNFRSDKFESYNFGSKTISSLKSSGSEKMSGQTNVGLTTFRANIFLGPKEFLGTINVKIMITMYQVTGSLCNL